MRAEYGVPGAASGHAWARLATSASRTARRSRVGASTDLMDQAWWSPGLIHPDGRAAFALCFTGGIFVDQAGRRFVNESAAYDRAGPRDPRAPCATAPSARRTGWSTTAATVNSHRSWRPMCHSRRRSEYRVRRAVAAGRYLGGARAARSTSPQTISPRPFAASTNWQRAATTRTSAAAGNPSTVRSPAVRRPWCRSTRRPTARRRSGCRISARRAGCAPTSMPASWTPTTGRSPGSMRRGTPWPRCPATTYPGGGNPIGASLLFSHRAALHMASQRKMPIPPST